MGQGLTPAPTRPAVRRARLAVLAVVLAVATGAAGAAVAFAAVPLGAAALSPRNANYRIDAKYDPHAHTVTAHETLSWQNPDRREAHDLYFHLYLNAFANNRSSFMRETAGRWAEWIERHPDGWGYITVTSVRIGGVDLTRRLRFVHPDDDNIDDRTVVRLPLDTPVHPGATVQVDIDFVAQLPKILARSGYAGPFTFAGQWFPKIGVFENGRWNCHQYHLTTEFFADFGVYDVSLTVPRDGIVGATGVLRDQKDNGDGTKTLHFVAADVHDFAWAIDPRFRVIEQRIAGITVRLLIEPVHLDQARRYLGAVRAAIEWYRRWIGLYPYPQLTIVDPGPGGGGAGGMEYPTLITAGTAWWMPRGLRVPEMVTIHEFGHQYWYGMVANNEFEDAWLDEGINSYVEGRIMDETYGAGSYLDLFGWRFDSVAVNRLEYLAAPQHDPLVRHAWQFLDRASYTAISYGKTALMLDTLNNELGGHRLRAALAAYFAEWRFRHPHGGDFLAAVEASTGQDLSGYFDQVVQGTGRLDYAVTRVNAHEAHEFQGYPVYAGRVGAAVEARKPPQKQYRSEVVVERLGSVRMPVDVQIVFEDGSVSGEHWDGRERWKRFEYTGGQRVEWAVVDPHNRLALDADWLNNSRMRDAGTRGIVRISSRWGFWYQNLLYLLTGL
jgi:Peptidase family M1 domain